MGKLVVTEFVSLDGVMEAPGGGEDYKHAGWSFEYDRGAAGDRFKLEELMDAEAQLLGRVTYEGFAAAWPKMEDEAGFAERMNSMPKYVVSSTLTDPEWANTRVLPDIDAVARLRDEVDGGILVAGSASLVHALFEADLVDELRLVVFPVLLGEGKRAFGEVGDKRALRLTGSETVGDGVSLLTYERVR
jgi:dihydrofolate reductase